ncbi:MAG TPA: VWA domain-containing protein, partial [Thermoanaerobaculia bacterium]
MHDRATIFRRAGGPALVLLFLVLGGAALVSRTTAQEPPSRGQFGERVNVREVLIDALVTDAHGNVIVGLGAPDFDVRENGKRVDLTGVTFYSNRLAVDGAGKPLAKGDDASPTEDRYFIVLFDQQPGNRTGAPRRLLQQLDAAKSLRDWVHGQLLPNDYVAVASYDYKLKVQQDFTRDRKALDEAVDDAVQGKDLETNYPSRIDRSGPSLLANLPQGNDLRDHTTNIYDGLAVLGQAAGKITGRKNLLLVSLGLGRVGFSGLTATDPVYYPRTMGALNNANVAVYAIDLAPPGRLRRLGDSLSQLTSDTGGQYYFNFVNFATPLKQV